MELLTTDRLHLQRLRLRDVTIIYRIWNRPEVRQYLWDDQSVSRETVRKLLELNEQHFAKDRYGLWLVYLAGSNRSAIGFAGLWHFFGEPKPQLLYGLVDEYQGNGYATEAADRVVNYAFTELGFPGLRACTDPPNRSSARVLERMGFVREGERPMEGKPTVFWWKEAPVVP